VWLQFCAIYFTRRQEEKKDKKRVAYKVSELEISECGKLERANALILSFFSFRLCVKKMALPCGIKQD
jgi:hypothetical protein